MSEARQLSNLELISKYPELKTRYLFSAILRMVRESMGIGQQELADELGVSRETLSLYENMLSVPKEPDQFIDKLTNSLNLWS